MGHVRRMQSNRRRQIHEMIKERELEERNRRQHDELSRGEGEVSQSECIDLHEEPGGNRRAS